MANTLRLKLSSRLILLTALAVASSVLAVGSVSFWMARQTLIEEGQRKLSGIAASFTAALDDYVRQIEQDLTAEAGTPFVAEALTAFNRAFDALGPGAETALAALYVTGNPHPVGERQKLDDAADGSSYSALHARLHPTFRARLEAHGYYDTFLFDLDGRVVYSVFNCHHYLADSFIWRIRDEKVRQLLV